MRRIQAILLGGCGAGVRGFIGACISNAARGITPLRFAQSIAGVLLGTQAFQGENQPAGGVSQYKP